MGNENSPFRWKIKLRSSASDKVERSSPGEDRKLVFMLSVRKVFAVLQYVKVAK